MDVEKGLEELPIEIVQRVVFESGLGCEDVMGVALTSKRMYGKILGRMGEENEYDVDQWKATTGVVFCGRRKWWRSARMAVERGYGDPGEEWSVFNHVTSKTTVLEEAAGAGEVEVVASLLADARVDPSVRGHRALRIAAERGREEVVRVLMACPEVDPSGGNNHAIAQAARMGHVEVVRLLLADARVDPSENESAPLRWASRYGHEDVVQLLLEWVEPE